MRWRTVLIGAIAAMELGGFAAIGHAAAPDDQKLADVGLAQRFSQQAQMSLGGSGITPERLRLSASYLEIAQKLDPTDPRYPRLLAEAELQLGGKDGNELGMNALSSYLQLQPNDMVAQLRLIELHFNAMDAADQKIKYVEQLINTPTLPAEVRAEVAVLGARLALERAETDRSGKYLEQALKLFPLCPEALDLKYEELDDDAKPRERVSLMLQMLRSNPAQPDVMAQLGNECAKVGLIDPSLMWFKNSFDAAQRQGVSVDPALVTTWGAEIVVADQMRAAEDALRGLMQQDPTNSDVAFLTLLVATRTKDQVKIEAAQELVKTTLETRLTRISDVLNERTPSTTQAGSNFNAAEDVKKLLELNRLDLSVQYVASLADLAWLKIYFMNQPAEAQQYLTPLRQILQPDSVTLARLDGWAYLADNKKDEARVKLSAVAEADPYSELGLIKLDTPDAPADKMRQRVNKLLNNNASGLMGATLVEALRDRVGIMPPAPDATGVREELDAFPNEWLDFVNFSKVKNFYALKGECLKVAHQFGEPIMAKITITNISAYDITIGPDGAIRPDLWVDVHVSGLQQQNFSGVAFDRMGMRFVIHPKESVSQVMRVDLDGLSGMLGSNPIVSVPLYFSVLTNPATQQNGIAPGPGGSREQFLRVVERSPSPLSPETFARLNQDLQNAPADVRMRTLELLGTFAINMRNGTDADLKSQSEQIVDLIRKGAGDRTLTVRDHAMMLMTFLVDESVRAGLMQRLLSSDDFQARALGIAAVASGIDPPKRKAMLQNIADNDPDPVLKRCAQRAIEVAEATPTTQPTTAPGLTNLGTSPNP